MALKISAVSDLIRLKKQYGTALLALPTLWSLFMASEGVPKPHLLLIFVLGCFLMRSAGCAINDIADRDFDRFVERTKTRPIASGALSVKEGFIVFFALLFLSFILVLFLNRLTMLLSLAAVGFAAAYPFIKRVSFFPQVFLGAAFGWGAVMAWSAVRGSPGATAGLIFIANIFWSAAYDTLYALEDVEDDKKIGVKSTAIFFGPGVYTAATVFYALMASLLWAAGLSRGAGVFYYAGVFLSLIFFLSIVHGVKNSKITPFSGFVRNVWGGALILLSIMVDNGI